GFFLTGRTRGLIAPLLTGRNADEEDGTKPRRTHGCFHRQPPGGAGVTPRRSGARPPQYPHPTPPRASTHLRTLRIPFQQHHRGAWDRGDAGRATVRVA